MTSQAIAGVREVDPTERHRQTERAAWDYRGLRPTEGLMEGREQAAGLARRLEALLR